MEEPYNTIVGFLFLVAAMVFAYFTTKEVALMKKTVKGYVAVDEESKNKP